MKGVIMMKRDTMERSTKLDRDSLFLLGVTIGSHIPEELPLTQKAVVYANIWHYDEKRESGADYVEHCIAVCILLINLGVYNDIILASAIIHDALEHEKTTLEEVEAIFGKEIAQVVDNQTRRFRESAKKYFGRVSQAIESILGKGADRVGNFSDMIEIYDLRRLKRYSKETELYILPMLREASRIYFEYSQALTTLHFILKSMLSIVNAYIKLGEIFEVLNEQCELKSTKLVKTKKELEAIKQQLIKLKEGKVVA